jgi:hypothetical protein
VKASSFSMIFRDGCSARVPADDAGFCAPCLAAVVFIPPTFRSMLLSPKYATVLTSCSFYHISPRILVL